MNNPNEPFGFPGGNHVGGEDEDFGGKTRCPSCLGCGEISGGAHCGTCSGTGVFDPNKLREVDTYESRKRTRELGPI